MKIYNTLTRKIEQFIPYEKGIVRMYTCGPTVYHYAHIGNLRSYIVEDILEKALIYMGYKVKRAMNITDIGHLTNDSDDGNDKMVEGAKKENKSVLEIAAKYTKSFFEDAEKLNIKKPDIIVPATTLIKDYIIIIQSLIDKEYAYLSNGNVYFDTTKIDQYYVLTNQMAEELNVASRDAVEEDIYKKNSADFVLWFTKSKFDDQELKWDSPWGRGYPGWHIECSTIALKYLGEYLDIHCGGVDNIFPHHTNEIAQAEAVIDHQWCKYWFHIEHLNDNKGKMSKSSGDVLTLSFLESKGYNPIVYRFYCLQSHYRNQLLFTYESLDGADRAYKKLKARILALKKDGELDYQKIKSYDQQFREAISNDLNTALMITTVFDVLKDKQLNESSKIYLIKNFEKVLSLNLFKEETNKFTDEEMVKIKARDQAKKEKDFITADKIREELLKTGIKTYDTKEGSKYERE
ncbi:MAG: cysteine--tRNA ligase [Tenericutes bacterium]|nr:cysteine--tRNA ligase [Mycoplasmatota bacterium]